jgi:hypothetical protein
MYVRRGRVEAAPGCQRFTEHDRLWGAEASRVVLVARSGTGDGTLCEFHAMRVTAKLNPLYAGLQAGDSVGEPGSAAQVRPTIARRKISLSHPLQQLGQH